MYRSGLERTAVAPATIGNVGVGFDVLGLAVRGAGDTVTATAADHGEVRIRSIEGDVPGVGEIPLDAAVNTAGIAADFTRRASGRGEFGVDLVVRKGIPLASGLGGSAASAAAAAFAVNQLLDSPLRTADLIAPCVEAEAAVAGRHADNVAPALLGGLVLIKELEPRVRLQRLPIPAGLMAVVVTPRVSLATKASRGALPESVPLSERSRNAANLAMFVSACYSGEAGQLAGCVEDPVVEAARLPLIPAGPEALQAARAAGAIGASISGAGPSLFALCHAPTVAASVRDAMVGAFAAAGLESDAVVSAADCPGASLVRAGGAS